MFTGQRVRVFDEHKKKKKYISIDQKLRDPNAPFTHPTQKYGNSERLLWDCMQRMEPVYENRVSKGKTIFDAGDVRSTIDNDLLEKSSICAQKADSLRQESWKSSEMFEVPAVTCKMRCFTTSCRMASAKRKSASSFSKMLWPTGPWNSERGIELMKGTFTHRRLHLDFLTVNLGNFVRGRKHTLPAVYAGFLDERDSAGVGPMVQSLARSRSHLIFLNEASELIDSEIAYLGDNGWLVHQNNAKDLAIVVRCNFIGGYIKQIVGSNYRSEAQKYLPMSYMICEICFGKCPNHEEIGAKQGSRNLRDYDHTNMSEDLTRAGMNVIRVCVFHTKSHVASRQPGLCHKAYGIMLADSFAFQTDIVAGDANVSGYRFGGSRQGSALLKHSCWQDMMRYFVRAYNEGQNQDPNCRVIPRFVSSNSLSSLRWWEDTFGHEYDRCRPVDWDTVPTLDCIMRCILEWLHSIDGDVVHGAAKT